MAHTHIYSEPLWHLPQIVGRGSWPLSRPRTPFDAHPGTVEDKNVGLPDPPCSSGGGVMGVVSTWSRVRDESFVVENINASLMEILLPYVFYQWFHIVRVHKHVGKLFATKIVLLVLM